MNITKSTLETIIGNKLPKTALSFFTCQDQIYFVGCKGKIFMSRPLSKVQTQKLKQANLLGTLGWSLN